MAYKNVEFVAPRPPAIVCPKCGATSGFHRAEVEQGNLGWLMFFFGGFIPYLLYRSSARTMLFCTRCHYVFEPQPPANPITAWIILIMVFIAIILVVASLLAK